MKRDKALGDEEVSALFVAHANTPSGMERTRRLFTTLNRYAKPVSKMEIIALDEDDIVAIVTRDMLEGDRILQERTSLSRGKNIAPSDRHSFTTVVALYDALNIYLGARRKNWNRIKRIRPEDSEIAGYLRSANALWNGLLSHFSPLQQLRSAPADDAVVTRYRNSTGGHLMFRPIGLVIVVAVITLLTQSGTTLEEATSLVAKAPMELGEEPWVGLLWDATNERMITTNVNQRVATAILFYLVGGDLSVISSSLPTLQEELAGILNKPTEEVDLSRLRQT